MAKVGMAAYSTLSVAGVLGIISAIDGYTSMSAAKTVFQEQEGLTLLMMGGIVLAISLLGGLVYHIGNAILDKANERPVWPSTASAAPAIPISVVASQPSTPPNRPPILTPAGQPFTPNLIGKKPQQPPNKK